MPSHVTRANLDQSKATPFHRKANMNPDVTLARIRDTETGDRE